MLFLLLFETAPLIDLKGILPVKTRQISFYKVDEHSLKLVLPDPNLLSLGAKRKKNVIFSEYALGRVIILQTHKVVSTAIKCS